MAKATLCNAGKLPSGTAIAGHTSGRCDCDCTLGDRSARRYTDFSQVLSGAGGGCLRRRRNCITLSGAARERRVLSAQHRLGQLRHDPRPPS
eukprot:scaffold10152_cov108-Isochrysis_galbana.AAC.3